MVAASKRPGSSTTDITARLWTQDLAREHAFEPLEIEGKLPGELRGTLFRNGPGQFGLHGTRYRHPFEADGAVTAVRIENGRAFGACKITESVGLAKERRAGKILYGLQAPWLRRVSNMFGGRQKNTANTNVMMWQGRLYALMEAAGPTELDPVDLAMRGESTLDNVVVSWFSAHPHRVESRKALYNFGFEMGRKPRLHMYELPDIGPARHLGAIDAPATMMHDFIATDTHLIFFLSPVRVHVPRMLLQLGGFADQFQWKPELGTEVICVPIDRPNEPIRFTIDAFYQWHFTNAFTRGRELVIDYVRYPDFNSFYEIGAYATGGGYNALGDSAAHRAIINLDAKTLRSEPTLARACEFPTVAPGREGREHAYSYLVLDELRGVGKLETQTNMLTSFMLPDTQRTAEPLFVPRSSNPTREDDGWLVALSHDGPSNRAFVAVYDAMRLPDGPIAKAWFDHQIPITYHGMFAAR